MDYSALRCAANNKSVTILLLWMQLLIMVFLKRFDQILVVKTWIWRYMIEQHRSDGAVVVGLSTHNERIEKLWRDVHRCVASVFLPGF